MSDDTPTIRFDQPGEAGSASAGGPGEPEAPVPGSPEDPGKRSRRVVIILAIVGGALLLAVIILLVVLFSLRGDSAPTPTPTATSDSPSPTPTEESPSPTPTPTPTQTVAPPPSTTPTVTAFTVSTTSVKCPAGGPDPTIAFSWTSTNAATAFFGIDTNDASQAPTFSNLPPNGSTNDFPSGYNPFSFTCSAGTHKYTITVVGNGQKSSKSVVVTSHQ